MDATHYYKVSMESPFTYFFTHREVFQQLLKSQLGAEKVSATLLLSMSWLSPNLLLFLLSLI